jgi:protein-L-isoaspartate(D-aspartate) O-methyltransferase
LLQEAACGDARAVHRGTGTPSVERARYAQALCDAAGVRTRAVRRAFACVPRERFLGPGPWQLFALPGPYQPTLDADPRRVYRDVPVAIDRARLLNNGQPSAVAPLIHALRLRVGAHVVHIGCGTGYYTAILAELVGPTGRVTAIEYDSGLAACASVNLADRATVTVVCADGTVHDPGLADAIIVNAGATTPAPIWLDRLRIRGRLVVPLTGPHAWGIVLAVTRRTSGFTARFLAAAGIVIFPCFGARDDVGAERLAAAFGRGDPQATSYWYLVFAPPDIRTARLPSPRPFRSDAAGHVLVVSRLLADEHDRGLRAPLP